MQKFTGMQYLAIDIANSFGQDKKTWDERLCWFIDNASKLEDLVSQADEPALFYAGVLAYRAAEKGEASGYPISLDATASGMQLLACLTGDRKAAEICNVVSTGQREDAYTSVWTAMQAKIGQGIEITRQQAKDAVMPALYGSEAMPKEVFGEKLHPIFEETMWDLAPGAWELNEAFLEIWDPTALSTDWVLPDNFHVHVKVMDSITETVHFMTRPVEIHRKVNTPVEKGRSLGANTIHSLDGMVVREMVRRCSYDANKVAWLRKKLVSFSSPGPRQPECHDDRMVERLWELAEQSGYLSARIIDHLNEDNLGNGPHAVLRELIDSLPAKPFQVVSVHDCFRCLPNHGNDLRQQYILQLHLIARSNMLGFLLSQHLKKPTQVGKLDPTLANDILKTEYALS